LRIAPELFLKRLVVGGFDRVFEINRNFRNEGLSTRHNPEFTMVEFYQAYATYEDLMNLTEELFQFIARSVLGTTEIKIDDRIIDFAKPFKRLTIVDAITAYNPDISRSTLEDPKKIRACAITHGVSVTSDTGIGKIQLDIFEKTTEHLLIEPTFIIAYRFELFIAGRELANGFSELNDPADQAARFAEQMQAKADGDEEAMPFDADYIEALEYGLPPTAGEGIGIDRLVMLLSQQTTIKDVILFPHMRPKS
jgi:lysyl-tRNA synthetase class 2